MKNKTRYIVELEKGVWIATREHGKSIKTSHKDDAKKYTGIMHAKRALTFLRKKEPFENAKIVKYKSRWVQGKSQETLRRYVIWRKADIYKLGKIECSCCLARSGLKLIDPNGLICENCWLFGKRCKKNKCSEPVCRGSKGLCREHYMNVDVKLDTHTLDDFAGYGNSSMAEFEDMLW